MVNDAEKAPLKKRTHVWMAITGAILTTTGIVGVFIKDTNVAGVPLLVLAGAAFLYVALTGQQLIQVSKDGVTFAALQQTLAEAAEDPEISEDAQARIVEIAEENGVHLDVLSPGEVEQRALRVLLRLGREYDFKVTQPEDGDADFVLVRGSDGVTAGVEVAARPLTPRMLKAIVDRFRDSAYEHKILVIAKENLTSSAGLPFVPDGIFVTAIPDMRPSNRLRKALQHSGFVPSP